MTNKANWLYDESGKIHKSLRSVTSDEIERLAREIDQRIGPRSPPCTLDVKQGDELLLHPVFRSSWDADWVRVVRVDRNPIMGVGFLCQSPDGTGGFTRPDMFVGWRRAESALEPYRWPDGRVSPLPVPCGD